MIPLLDISNLTVQFDTDRGKVQALDCIDLNLKSGEVMALVGESGSGKTTLGRAILNIIPSPHGKIVKGQILFQRQNVLEMSEDESNAKIRGKSITLIPQDPFSSANPLFTIKTQLKDVLKSLRIGEEEMNMRMTNIFRKLQLPDDGELLRKYPHELSGGQLQRIMIAAALLPNPSLIIADEPTTSLDVTVEAQILQLFRRIVKEHGVTVLYITHNLAVASKVSDKITVVYAGQIMESAPTDIFFNNTAHPYSKKLLQCLPKQQGDIEDIGGSVPNLIDPPRGCRFHPRCEFADQSCFQNRPPNKEIEPEHWISCYH